LKVFYIKNPKQNILLRVFIIDCRRLITNL
jgi:hypothetical protein